MTRQSAHAVNQLAAAMPEAELQEHVRRLCRDLGLFHYHTRLSVRSEPGWPDSVIVGRRVLYRELKSEYGRLTPDQQRVGELLVAAGQSWSVWRPTQLLNGQIARELADVAAIQMALFGPVSASTDHTATTADHRGRR